MSAKTGDQIPELFDDISRKIVKTYDIIGIRNSYLGAAERLSFDFDEQRNTFN